MFAIFSYSIANWYQVQAFIRSFLLHDLDYWNYKTKHMFVAFILKNYSIDFNENLRDYFYRYQKNVECK